MIDLITHLIPASLHRLILRIVHNIRLIWWRLRKPRLTGCRVVVVDERGRVLLIRHSYGNRRWMLPGGGMKRGEDPLICATREVAEETGICLTAPRLVCISDERAHGAPNTVHIVRGVGEGVACPDGREVVEAVYFAWDNLPDGMLIGLGEHIQSWLSDGLCD